LRYALDRSVSDFNVYCTMGNTIITIRPVSIVVMFLVLSTLSCATYETSVPITADFTLEVSGRAPYATVTVTNKSVGVKQYQWIYSQFTVDGDTMTTDPEPRIAIDRAGIFTIKLIATNGIYSSVKTDTVTILGSNAIQTFTGLEFALNAGDPIYGRLFSFSNNKMYRDSEIDTTTAPLINLAFGSRGDTSFFFRSPTDTMFHLKHARTAIIDNSDSADTLTVGDFDAMMDDAILKTLVIKDTINAFNATQIPGVVPFQLHDGRRGLIKTRAVNSSRLLADVKLQKY